MLIIQCKSHAYFWECTLWTTDKFMSDRMENIVNTTNVKIILLLIAYKY